MVERHQLVVRANGLSTLLQLFVEVFELDELHFRTRGILFVIMVDYHALIDQKLGTCLSGQIDCLLYFGQRHHEPFDRDEQTGDKLVLFVSVNCIKVVGNFFGSIHD